ncbi:TPA: 16S rRNA (adenine(1518)-N(6)/adenine(1519)-N(6))-dimethyltransferase RsmA [Candidatus Avacholeplasma faecigallinarum]|nr:16S rRNA (adenine(1518)-N(6)/adenine(1519)-N(6))-dimethyltransferase RsmA [Candidatus Avacholeplasma faecigallinarum]
MQNKIGSQAFVNKTLNENNLHAKKKFGQNFLTDQNILNQIVEASDLDRDTAVIEIGPGLGSLTERLCENAGFVLAYEIDTQLIPILHKNLARFTNYEVVNEDILKVDINKDISEKLGKFKKIHLVANLPYYITTPIILNLLSQTKKIQKYIMMMQLEVCDRICGKPKTKDYNALSVVIQYRAMAKKVCKVPRSVFIPQPNVDSAVVKLQLYEVAKYKAKDEQFFFEFIRECFTQRRKTLINNLSNKYDKNKVLQILKEINLNPAIRSEELTIEQFIYIADRLK